MHEVDVCALAAHTTSCPTRSASRIPSELADQLAIKLKNHENGMSGPATVGQLHAAALSVRVLHQSASTVPSCIHVVLPPTPSTKPTSADKGTHL